LIARSLALGVGVALALAAVPARAGETPLSDGGFENGPPPASAWSETTNQAADCPSNIGDWSSIWGLAASEGSLDFWAGGACLVDNAYLPISSAVGRLIDVPASEPILRFRYAAFRVDPDDTANNDVVYIRVNGIVVWGLDVSKQSSNTFDGASGGFVDGAVDLCASAGSAAFLTVTLAPGAGSNVGNVRFDDFRVASADGIFVHGFECGTAGWSEVAE